MTDISRLKQHDVDYENKMILLDIILISKIASIGGTVKREKELNAEPHFCTASRPQASHRDESNDKGKEETARPRGHRNPASWW
jgi:hypothetical protein